MTKLDTDFLDRFTDTIGPVGKSLGMLIRPAFVAAPGKRLVWGDFANIEARVLPWLAASPGAETKLDIFRAADADPSKPDVYIAGAAVFVHRDAQELWNAYRAGDKEAKSLRQSHGKVPELSLGYGGGPGALQKMAINYRVYVDEVEAKHMVDTWRAANPWAVEFWGKFFTDNKTGEVTKATGLWGAVNMALRNPGTPYTAGRIAYVFDQGYMDGTLFCALPCGRLLTYPDCKLRTRTVVDKDTQEKTEKHAMWYRKGYGWSVLWAGKCSQGPAQAVAGSVLRETLVELDHLDPDEVMPTVGHTHDEVMLETDDEPKAIAAARARLSDVMGVWRPDWRANLPLVAEVVDHEFYTKSVG